jgi:dinuclear metal center YbgI/SA1388 family protein
MASESAGVSCSELVSYLDNLLDVGRTADLSPNGLQVEGAETVRRIVTGVSACRELFEQARQRGADTLMVHHGIFWRGDPQVLTGFRRRRVAELFEGNLNLIAYHLPLDRHLELGNNALAARRFGLQSVVPFGNFEGASLGVRGQFETPVSPRELAASCLEVFGQAPQVFDGGRTEIRTLGIISGAAQRELHTAVDEGLDAFITGEVSEWVVNVTRETGVAYFAAGHYATEVLGIRKLGEHVAERFGVEVEFVDVPNPV